VRRSPHTGPALPERSVCAPGGMALYSIADPTLLRKEMAMRRKQTTRPYLEALENRSCPSCTFIQEGTTLVGRGDAGDDTVAIVDDGTGVIQVTCNRDAPQTFRGIDLTRFTDLGGNNGLHLFYAPRDPSLPGDYVVDMLGDGQNLITLSAL